MTNFNKIISVFALAIVLFAASAKADFVQTPIYFSVPTSTSFTVYTISASANAATAAPYPLTENYYFNSSTLTNALINVCITGGSACQNDFAKPAFRFQNTGTVNISIYQQFNASLPTGVLVCGNSTKLAVGCGGIAKPSCVLGELNSSGWMLVGTQLGTDSLCNQLNETIYASFTNFNGGAGGTFVVGLTHNSTSSN